MVEQIIENVLKKIHCVFTLFYKRFQRVFVQQVFNKLSTCFQHNIQPCFQQTFQPSFQHKFSTQFSTNLIAVQTNPNRFFQRKFNLVRAHAEILAAPMQPSETQ